VRLALRDHLRRCRPTTRGEPFTIHNAICIHEEDNAVLWKHIDVAAERAEVRRARRLVVSAHLTVANYEYLVYWRFYQDGSIECEVRASGIMVATHFADEEPPPYGRLMDGRTCAPLPKHVIVARLDMDVDGENNTVIMSESEPLPTGPDKPHAGHGATERATADRSGGQAGLLRATQRT
jgi:primary-amine oxidase